MLKQCTPGVRFVLNWYQLYLKLPLKLWFVAMILEVISLPAYATLQFFNTSKIPLECRAIVRDSQQPVAGSQQHPFQLAGGLAGVIWAYAPLPFIPNDEVFGSLQLICTEPNGNTHDRTFLANDEFFKVINTFEALEEQGDLLVYRPPLDVGVFIIQIVGVEGDKCEERASDRDRLVIWYYASGRRTPKYFTF